MTSQAPCNSCAAQAAVTSLESCLALSAGAAPVPLSAQHLLDCTLGLQAGAGTELQRINRGCTDGFPDIHLKYVMESGGKLQTEENYPLQSDRKAGGFPPQRRSKWSASLNFVSGVLLVRHNGRPVPVVPGPPPPNLHNQPSNSPNPSPPRLQKNTRNADVFFIWASLVIFLLSTRVFLGAKRIYSFGAEACSCRGLEPAWNFRANKWLCADITSSHPVHCNSKSQIQHPTTLCNPKSGCKRPRLACSTTVGQKSHHQDCCGCLGDVVQEVLLELEFIRH